MAPIQYVRGLIVRVQKDSPTSITLIFAWCEKLGDVQVQPGALQVLYMHCLFLYSEF